MHSLHRSVSQKNHAIHLDDQTISDLEINKLLCPVELDGIGQIDIVRLNANLLIVA